MSQHYSFTGVNKPETGEKYGNRARLTKLWTANVHLSYLTSDRDWL